MRIASNFKITKKALTKIEGKRLLNGESNSFIEFYEVQIENKTSDEVLRIYLFIEEKNKEENAGK